MLLFLKISNTKRFNELDLKWAYGKIDAGRAITEAKRVNK